MATEKTSPSAAAVADITRAILVLHRRRVILDADLAALYGVTTKRLNEQVKRNTARFPADFMLRLSPEETEALNRSHFGDGSSFSVEGMAVADEGWAEADEGCCPQLG
jgi:hypothetical protein